MAYQRLTLKDRYLLSAELESGKKASEIARKLSVSRSTICRELKRAEGGNYSAVEADDRAKLKSSSRKKAKYKLRSSFLNHVVARLNSDWSPEQISGRRRHLRQRYASYQTIYRMIERDKTNGGMLFKRCRFLRKERADRKLRGFRYFKDPRENRLSIEERAKVVMKRKRLGDYERDTVFGKKNGTLLLTIVDRFSRKLWIEKISRKCSHEVHEATVKALRKEKVQTITNDNGPEFLQHKKTSKDLGTKIYFSRAYASWERGTNENTNGLVRQYFPRKRSMDWATKTDVRKVESKLNNRPRKVLGYRTPNEVHRLETRRLLR